MFVILLASGAPDVLHLLPFAVCGWIRHYLIDLLCNSKKACGELHLQIKVV